MSRSPTLLLPAKSWRQWPWTRWGVVLVGLLFLLAGFGKALRPQSLLPVLHFDGINGLLIDILLWAVPLLDVFVGSLLISHPRSRVIGWIALALLALYTAQLAFLVGFPNAPLCGCMGVRKAMVDARGSNALGIGRNLACALLLWPTARPKRPD